MNPWRERYDQTERAILMGERMSYRMLRFSSRIPEHFSFREYMRERLDAISYTTWNRRVNGHRVDIDLVETSLVIERWLRLAGPGARTLTRNEWIAKHNLVPVNSIEVSIGGRPEILSGGWSLIRVGSVWHEDVEYHVYVPSEVLTQMRRCAREAEGRNVHAISSVFVFRRNGDSLAPASSAAVQDKAGRVFRRLVESMVHGERRRG